MMAIRLALMMSEIGLQSFLQSKLHIDLFFFSPKCICLIDAFL